MYAEQHGRAMAYKEIFNLLASAGKMARETAKQIKKPSKDYGL
jgi:hypothetical protein